jgi:hypothetical protein
MQIDEIKEKLGQGSVFGEVPFLVFSRVFRRISTGKQNKEFIEMISRIRMRDEHWFLVYMAPRDLDDPA